MRRAQSHRPGIESAFKQKLTSILLVGAEASYYSLARSDTGRSYVLIMCSCYNKALGLPSFVVLVRRILFRIIKAHSTAKQVSPPDGSRFLRTSLKPSSESYRSVIIGAEFHPFPGLSFLLKNTSPIFAVFLPWIFHWHCVYSNLTIQSCYLTNVGLGIVCTLFLTFRIHSYR